MKSSASQLENLDLCGRKWWFRSVAKLPEPPKGDSVAFGSVLHGCAERYLLGEEPFPNGWDIDKDSGSRIHPADAMLIRLLINKSIEAGYLERRPGMEIEKETRLPAIQGVELIVKKDFSTKDRVEDHKTSKADRYFKTSKGLKKTIQMMIYAKDLLHQANLRGEVLDVITLVHNQYLRDYENPTVSRVEVDVTAQEVEDFWQDTVLPLIRKQVELAKVTNVFEIPEPPPSACRAFGGCPRISICSGQEDLLQYRKRIDSLLKKKKPMTTPQIPVQPKNPADFLAERAKAAAIASGQPPAINPPAPAAQPASAQIAAPSGYTPPPWASDACPLCKASKFRGFTSKGVPCRFCESLSKVSKEGYSWETAADGSISWWKGEKQVVSIPPQATVADAGSKHLYGIDDLYKLLAAALTADDVVALASKAETTLGEGTELDLFLAAVEKRMEGIDAPEEKQPAPFTPPTEPVKRPPGRPRKNPAPPAAVAQAQQEAKPAVAPAPEVFAKGSGYTLLIGCAVLRGENTCVLAETVLDDLPGYWDEAAFDRRGKIRKQVTTPEFLKRLDGLTIVQRGRDPDVDNLMSALLANASTVIQGTVQ